MPEFANGPACSSASILWITTRGDDLAGGHEGLACPDSMTRPENRCFTGLRSIAAMFCGACGRMPARPRSGAERGVRPLRIPSPSRVHVGHALSAPVVGRFPIGARGVCPPRSTVPASPENTGVVEFAENIWQTESDLFDISCNDSMSAVGRFLQLQGIQPGTAPEGCPQPGRVPVDRHGCRLTYFLDGGAARWRRRIIRTRKSRSGRPWI